MIDKEFSLDDLCLDTLFPCSEKIHIMGMASMHIKGRLYFWYCCVTETWSFLGQGARPVLLSRKEV